MGTIVASYYFAQYSSYQREYTNLVDQFATYNNNINALVDQLASYNDLVHQLGADIEEISVVIEGVSLKASTLLSYGNGTKAWFNNTALPLGSTAFTAIYYLAEDINYTDYGGELGILVTSINGVANNSTHGWLFWQWDPQDSMWRLPAYSSGRHLLHKGEVIAFAFVNYMKGWPPQPPN
jgi:hypothetical protein